MLETATAGAGPDGLSLGAHIRHIGIPSRIFVSFGSSHGQMAVSPAEGHADKIRRSDHPRPGREIHFKQLCLER
jgi:hypothetical protein